MSAQKKAAFQILAFLDASLKDGSIREDDKEGIEVASTVSFSSPIPSSIVLTLCCDCFPGQCISEAFGVDLEADKAAYSIEPESLVSLLDKHVAAPVCRFPFRLHPTMLKHCLSVLEEGGRHASTSTESSLSRRQSRRRETQINWKPTHGEEGF